MIRKLLEELVLLTEAQAKIRWKKQKPSSWHRGKGWLDQPWWKAVVQLGGEGPRSALLLVVRPEAEPNWGWEVSYFDPDGYGEPNLLVSGYVDDQVAGKKEAAKAAAAVK